MKRTHFWVLVFIGSAIIYVFNVISPSREDEHPQLEAVESAYSGTATEAIAGYLGQLVGSFLVALALVACVAFVVARIWPYGK